MEVTDIFKVPIFSKKIEVDSEKIISECLRLKEKSPGRILSNMGGWQSNSILNNKVFDDLLVEVNTACFDFSNYLKLKISGQLEYWININQYSNFNRQHMHPGCIFSAVYYAKYPENSGEIGFLSPSHNTMGYDWSKKLIANNNYNSVEYRIVPQEGFLLVFPSWLEHYVGVNQNKDEDRITIAFNVN